MLRDSPLDGLTIVTLDRLGREKSREKNGFAPGSRVRSDTAYDYFFLSKPRTVTDWYEVGASPSRKTDFVYDALGRTAYETFGPGEDRVYTYDGLRRRIDWLYDYGSAKKSEIVETDDRGRVIRSGQILVDATGTREIANSFAYGPFDRLFVARDPMGNESRFEYDRRGRRKFVHDVNTGATEFQYNAFGEVERAKTDRFDVEYGYDALGRPIGHADEEGLSCLFYDGETQATGKLSQTVAADGTTNTLSYDALGLVREDAWLISGSAYSASYAYTLGRLSSVRYPDGRTVRQTYAPSGALQEYTEDGFGSLWRADEADASGRLLHETFGDGSSTSYSYHSLVGRPVDIHTQRAGISVFHETYGYHGDGKLSFRKDELKPPANPDGNREFFDYDTLDRLVGWRSDGSSPWAVGYQYNDAGSLTVRLVTGAAPGTENAAFTYRSDKPHALKDALIGSATHGYDYDQEGNQISGPGRTVSYNSFRLPRAVTTPTTTENYRYDALGARVGKEESGVTSHYVPGLYEHTNRLGSTTTVAHVGGVASVVVGPYGVERSYGHVDALGSVVSTTSAGSPGVGSTNRHFDPFGRVVRGAGFDSLRQGFTGHSHDSGDLINMGGRIYDAQTTSFLTADPLVGPLGSGAALNRYAYALLSPTNFWDPTGFETASGGGPSTPMPCSGSCTGSLSSGPPSGLLGAFMPPGTPVCIGLIECQGVVKGLSLAAGAVPSGDFGGPGGPVLPWKDVLDFYNSATTLPATRAQKEAAAKEAAEYDQRLVAGASIASTVFLPAKALFALGVLGLIGSPATDSYGDVVPDLLMMLGGMKGALPTSLEAKCAGGLCPCFAAGTLVDTAEGSQPIELVELGQRVGPEAPECSRAELETWREVDLEMAVRTPAGPDYLEIRLLRPEEWIRRYAAQVGSVIQVNLDDLNVAGPAHVSRIGQAGAIGPGTRCPVTGWVRHLSRDVVELELNDAASPLLVTRHHRLFSADRDAWVQAGEIRPSERLVTRSGTVRAQVRGGRTKPAEVFNLEVFSAHQYFVGEQRVLAHNAYTGPGPKPMSGWNPPKITVNRHGQLTNGVYTIDSAGMRPHMTGNLSTGKSQWLSGVDVEKAVLDAAAKADAEGLWVGNKAKVQASTEIGALGGSGELTNYINVYRTKTGFVHGSPGNAPIP